MLIAASGATRVYYQIGPRTKRKLDFGLSSSKLNLLEIIRILSDLFEVFQYFFKTLTIMFQIFQDTRRKCFQLNNTLPDMFRTTFKTVSDTFKTVSNAFQTVSGTFKTASNTFKTVSNTFKTVADTFKTVSDTFKAVLDQFHISFLRLSGLYRQV